jgi:hypothetical protein
VLSIVTVTASYSAGYSYHRHRHHHHHHRHHHHTITAAITPNITNKIASNKSYLLLSSIFNLCLFYQFSLLPSSPIIFLTYPLFFFNFVRFVFIVILLCLWAFHDIIHIYFNSPSSYYLSLCYIMIITNHVFNCFVCIFVCFFIRVNFVIGSQTVNLASK